MWQDKIIRGAQAREGHVRAGRMRGALLGAFLLCSTLMPWGAASVGADEGSDGGSRRLALQIFDVGSLTCGWASFLGECAPPTNSRSVSDYERPLFGSVAEEPTYALGQVDELIELVHGFVQPHFWESTDGAFLCAMGERSIVAKASPEVLAEVATFLASLERRTLQSATVEVRVGRTGSGEAAASLSLCGFLGQRVSAFAGTRRAYLQDFAVQVAESSAISDPVVGVANLGLRVDVRVLAGGDDKRILVDIDAFLARLADARSVAAGLERTVDAPAFHVFETRASLEVTPGKWTPISGDGISGDGISGDGGSGERAAGDGTSAGWTLEIRVTPRVPVLAAARPNPLRIEPAGASVREVELIDVNDLNHAVAPTVLRIPGLLPSNFTPPEPPELPEPGGAILAHHLPQLLLELSPANAWEDPCSIEARNGQLIVRNTSALRAGVHKVLAKLRREFLWSMDTRVVVVELPVGLLSSLRATADAGFVLAPHAAALLEAKIREGTVKRLGRVTLPGRAGVPNAVMDGEHVAYLQDQEVQLAKGAAISNPIMRSFFSGLVLEVTPQRTSGGGAVAMDIRVTRTSHEKPIRRVMTPSGAVEFPSMHVFRIRAGVVVPFGRTALLAVRGERGATRRAILLTPTLRSK